MIHTLRKRLSLLMITVITAVLLCAAVLVLFLSERMFNENERSRLNIQADQLAQTVKINELLQTSQLAKLEVSNGLIISIWDEGGPIPFHGGWQPASDRDSLISQAMEQVSDYNERWDGIIRGEHGERYLATVRRVSNYRFIRTVVMLQDEQSADTQRAGQRWRYAAIAILVFILIAYLCWLFTGKMIQPIKEAHEQQNQFVSAASHDLRTPLQVIRVNAEALKLNPPDRDRFIDRILKELTHVSNLSEDLLTLTTAPDDSTAQGNPVEISDLVNNAVDYYKGAAVQKGISLSSRLPAEALPLIEGNEAMLQKALNILVDNAVCYTPAGGHITVEASLQSRNVIIAVQDDGPGVALEHQSRIFDRFYRADKNRTDRAHSGLGLSIAKKVVNDHGGKLTYKTAEPHGSVFSIILPCLHGRKA